MTIRRPFTNARAGSQRYPRLRWRGLALLLSLACLLAGARRVRAQATPSDTAAILLDAAARLEGEGRTAAASALRDYVREHYGDAAAPGQAASQRAAGVAGRATGASATGRTELIVWGTTYGIALGLAVPAAFNANSAQAWGLGLLLGAPVGYAASRIYADATDLTEGQARAITFGGTWGAWQGYGLARVLGLLERTSRVCVTGQVPECVESKSTPASSVVRAMIVGSLAGVGTGAVLGPRNRVSPGTATAANLAALWGTWYGVGTAVAIGGTGGRTPLTFALLGGDAALLGAAYAAPRLQISRERARLISIAGLAGVLAGAGLDLLLRVDNEKVGFAIPLGTGTVGLLLGAGLTSGMPPEVAGAGAPGGVGALLHLENGRWGLGLPAPAPVIGGASGRGAAGKGGTGASSVYVPLLRARF